jgi:hypothetical protein
MPRPSKISKRTADRVLEAVRAGATREAAASAGPIARSTLYAWIREGRLHPDSAAGAFVEELERADDAAELMVIREWTTHFSSDWRSCAMFLERRFPQRWARPVDGVALVPFDASEAVPSIEERADALLHRLDADIALAEND